MSTRISFLFILTLLILGETRIAFSQEKSVQQEKPNVIQWLSFEEAVKRGKTEPRKIFIDVYTSWCGWCKHMDATTFKHPVIIDYLNKKYYAVKLNAETRDTIRFMDKMFVYNADRRANEIALALLQEKLSYPTSVYLDEGFNMLNPVPGYIAAGPFEMVLKYYGEDMQKKISWEEFQKRFKGEVK